MSVLKEGSSGGSVTELQKQLSMLGFQVEVDGKFGPITHAAVRAFQQKVGLTADGLAGPNTLAQIQTILANPESIAKLQGDKGGDKSAAPAPLTPTEAAEKARYLAEKAKGSAGNKSAV